MTPESFRRWLLEMRLAGLAKNDSECARLLGSSRQWINRIKRDGIKDYRFGLACAALLNNLPPYGEKRETPIDVVN